MSDTTKRWIVYYNMYDKRGALINRGSDNEVFATTYERAKTQVRQSFHDKTLWPHVIVKVTDAKLYGSQSVKHSGLKQFLVTYTLAKDVGSHSGGQHFVKKTEGTTKINAKNKTEAANLVKDYFNRTANRATLTDVKVIELGVE